MFNLIICEFFIKSTPFCDTIIITYEIELPPSVRKLGFNLLYYLYCTITYVVGTISNSPSVHQLMTQVKKYVWIIYINVLEPITYKGAHG